MAHRYDRHPRGDEAETVEFLAGLAGGRSALEFAIGTGRVAIPLTEAGVRVDGIELSPDMVARMREKPGGDKVDVTLGDMATASAPGERYPLVYLVFNTIRLAGLRLVNRWSGWEQEPFTAASDRHISVYAKLDSGASRP